MTIALYMDHHVPSAITEGLRQRGVEVLTAWSDGYADAEGERILERAGTLDRLVYTNDDDFLAIAHRWLLERRNFAGLAYAHPQGVSVRQAIDSLELIAKASDAHESRNVIYYLPFS